MAFMRNLWDGILSLGAAVGTVAIVGVPLWCAHLAVNYGIASTWAYAPMAALLVVGGIMVLAFLRKAASGVAPLRDRKRR